MQWCLALLALVLVQPAAGDGKLQDSTITEFSVNIYRYLSSLNKDRNIFYSPLSIATALGMVELGTNGTTLEQIQHAMGYSKMAKGEEFLMLQNISQAMNEPSQQYLLKLANSLFVQDGFQLSDKFLQMMKQYFNASVKNVDFNHPSDVAVYINQWVLDCTNHRIQKLVSPSDFTALSRLVLVNAIYFKGSWKSQFRPELTQAFPFTKDDESEVQISMMYQQGEFYYGEFTDGTDEAGGIYQVVELPYKGDEMSMMIVLPRQEVQLASIEPLLKTQQINEWANSIKKEKVEVFLPKFKVKQSIDLKEVLSSLGMSEMFDMNADLSAMTERNDLYISKAVHVSYLEVNEEGSEAAGVSGMIISNRMGSLAPQVLADHPFFFLIRNRKTGTIYFMGRVMHPEDIDPTEKYPEAS
ncbi:neuroserpin precursor [Callorhinchus milii]|nr:neuroserpin precursor [Callorhinchus milii]AFM91007.1 neuroserpin [Callorhinchus milii]|eukprot:gi/632934896/ref/XP_007886909.1/ PREDICTED: neuroserpin [Callorhinchus milii]